MDNQNPKPSSNRLLLKYAGLGMQIMVSLALGVFIGLKVDGWLHFSTPIFVWIIPLAIIIVMIVQVIRDTSKNK